VNCDRVSGPYGLRPGNAGPGRSSTMR
jgi:hypothetical protein